MLIPKDWKDDAALRHFRDVGEALGRTLRNRAEVTLDPTATPDVSAAARVKPADGSTIAAADAVPVSVERLISRTDRVLQYITSEPANERSALVDLQRSFRTLRIPTVSVPFSNEHRFSNGAEHGARSAELPAASGTLGVNGALGAAIEHAKAVGVKVDENQIQALPEMGRVARAAQANPTALAAFSTQYERTINALSNLLVAPADPQSLENFRHEGAKTREEFIASWPRLANDPQARRVAVRTIDSLSMQPELKAIYGVMTNFTPPSYRQVYHNSRRTVGIMAGADIICSGIALDREWVLTAGHCFIGRDWTQMRVAVALDGFAQGVRTVTLIDQWPYPAPGQEREHGIDYAFVRIARDDAVAEVTKALDDEVSNPPTNGPKELRPPCIRTSPVTYREPVFVIAHRYQDKKVHDHAYVVFPHRITEKDYQELSAEVGRRLVRVAETVFSDSKQQNMFVARGEEHFRASYQRFDPQGRPSYYEYRVAGAEFSAKRPFFGLDSDTFHGNSGGPVFSRNDTCIVGVFSAGAPDGLSATDATAREHEYATPIGDVLAHVRAEGERLESASAGASQDVLDKRRELLETLKRLEDAGKQIGFQVDTQRAVTELLPNLAGDHVVRPR